MHCTRYSHRKGRFLPPDRFPTTGKIDTLAPSRRTGRTGRSRSEDSNVLTKLWGIRWWMMSLLMLGSVINYLTRATLAVAAPTVLKDLHITTQQYSWVLSAFQFAIMLQPLCG